MSKPVERKQKSSYWSEIKSLLIDYSTNDLLHLVSDLYFLSSSNKDFLEARFLKDGHILDRYKEQIQKYLAPKEPWKDNQKINLKDAKKVLNEYKKATCHKMNLIDLLVYYVECGTNFLDTYGDMEEQYYLSLESVFEEALKLMREFDVFEVHDFIKRLKKVIKVSSDMGWGYYDQISQLFEDAYPSESV